jgi:hypothetical protein
MLAAGPGPATPPATVVIVPGAGTPGLPSSAGAAPRGDSHPASAAPATATATTADMSSLPRFPRLRDQLII